MGFLFLFTAQAKIIKTIIASHVAIIVLVMNTSVTLFKSLLDESVATDNWVIGSG